MTARMCRACGADADCGWDEADWGESDASGGNEAFEDDFDYDDFVRREFPESHSGSTATGSAPGFWVSVVLFLVLVSLLLSMVV
ncbi:MAG: hypothetical protein NXI04_06680 [Planctomycetaceae bacterium]|nr:hypothetical protein [Planctomycetaceae bacterium]